MIKKIAIVLGLLSPVPLAVMGAVLQETWLIYVMLVSVVAIVGLVGLTNYIPAKLYPLAIFAISLALIYQTTLISPYLVGTDIHSEYNYYLNALDGWDRTIQGNYNTAIGLVWVAPFLTHITGIDGVWIFKAIYPFMFSFAPVLLYLAFKDFIGRKVTFLACFFFVSAPPFLLEVVQITKLQLSGLCLAFIIFLLFYRGWSQKLRLWLVVPTSLLLIMFHYSTGYIYLYFIGGGACLVLLAWLCRWAKPTLPLKSMFILVGIIVVGIVGYFTLIGSTLSNPAEWIEPAKYVPPPFAQVITQQEPVIKTALGLDFMSATIEGKVFRVFQILTELFIAVGFIGMVVRYRCEKRFPLEYTALCGAGLLLILACIILPDFSKLINMTRFYHLALYFIAPLVVIGGIYLLKPWAKTKAIPILTLGLLLPYFIFTSGAVFEALKRPDISSINIPYSLALSHQRVDMAGICTEDDHKALEWINQNKGDARVFTDIHGAILMLEWVTIDNQIDHIPLDVGTIPDDAWVFLRERNQDDRIITYHAGIGLRKSISYDDLGIDGLLSDRPVLYHNSNAYVYGGKDATD